MLFTKLKLVSSVLLVGALTCYGVVSIMPTVSHAGPVGPAWVPKSASRPAEEEANKNVAAAPQGRVPLILDEDIKIEVRGVLQHSQFTKNNELGNLNLPATCPWTVSARGVTFALDLSQSFVLIDLSKERFHGKKFLLKGTIDGESDGRPLFKVQQIEPVDG